MNANNKNLQFECWGAAQFAENLAIIKEFRKIYSHYPYLYEYDETEEAEYLQAYLQSGDDLDVFVCRQDDEIIGISIGCKLNTSISICECFQSLGLDIDNAYYFGDIIIAKNTWGQGIAKQLYEHHIAFAKNKGYYSIFALLIERDNSDSRQPAGYQPSSLRTDFDFVATEHLVHYEWATPGASQNNLPKELHTLRVYKKKLTAS